MEDRELEREIARGWREEDHLEERLTRLTVAIRTGLLQQTYAGCWQDGDGTLVVAVTTDPDGATRRLRKISPQARFRVVTAEHSFAELETLAEAIWQKGDRIHAPVVATGIDEKANRVTVTLERVDAPSSQALREQFASQPVDWEEGTVEAA